MTPQFIEAVAILACTLFTGAAIYISAVEHPARLSCGAEAAVAEWAPSYKRATLMQVPLALVAGLFGIVRGTQCGGPLWLSAAMLILAVIPCTLLAIRPTNNRLLDPSRDRRSDETLQLLNAWGRLHTVRGALSMAASMLFIWAVRAEMVTIRRKYGSSTGEERGIDVLIAVVRRKASSAPRGADGTTATHAQFRLPNGVRSWVTRDATFLKRASASTSPPNVFQNKKTA